MTREEIVKASKDAEGGMYIVIPSVVQLDTELTLSARMLYGIITWKCNTLAYTWANNRDLGELLGVSGKRVSELLSLLEKRGHIETEIEYKPGTKEIVRRYIYPIMKSSRGVLRADPPPKNRDTPPSEYGYLPPGIGGPPPKNTEVICNIKKENKNNSPYSPPGSRQAAGPVVGQSPMTGPDSPADCPGDGAPAEPEVGTSFGCAERLSRQPAAALDKPKRGRRDKSAPAHSPEAFEIFWESYPRKDNRKKAIDAWDKLKPDQALCRVMYGALKRQCQSEQWAEDGGKYIPMFSTWLNQRRWENQGVDLSLLKTSKPPASSGGWADWPGVTS